MMEYIPNSQVDSHSMALWLSLMMFTIQEIKTGLQMVMNISFLSLDYWIWQELYKVPEKESMSLLAIEICVG